MSTGPQAVVTAVELVRGGAPGWSMTGVLSAVQSFMAGHWWQIGAGIAVLAGAACWVTVRRAGPVGIAGLLLLVGLAMRGELRRMTSAVRRSKRGAMSLAAAVLAED